PFTTDAVYQRGYCRTYNFLRIALAKPDLNLLLAFLSGKMAVEDAWLVKALIGEGLCVGPAFTPDWFRDLDGLLATMTHSLTMNRFSTQSVPRYLDRKLDRQIGPEEEAPDPQATPGPLPSGYRSPPRRRSGPTSAA